MTAPAIVAAGDSALVLRLGDTIDVEVNARALRVAQHVQAARDAAIRDIVIGYASVTVYFDPLAADAAMIRERLARADRLGSAAAAPAPRRATLTVAYGGEAGPDLTEVATFAGCSEEEVIALHLGRDYRVFFLGFLPGFPYLGLVDERIAVPRRDTPRLRVPAGSVGIAGRQTGVYPTTSPGGWRLIGRTDAVLFDPARGEPALLQPGDTVRFTRA
jgi:inhibitor of KinA